MTQNEGVDKIKIECNYCVNFVSINGPLGLVFLCPISGKFEPAVGKEVHQQLGDFWRSLTAFLSCQTSKGMIKRLFLK